MESQGDVVAHIDRMREEAIQRIMLTFDMDRKDAANIVDRAEGQLFDFDDTLSLGDGFDVDISEQVTRLILPMDEHEDD